MNVELVVVTVITVIALVIILYLIEHTIFPLVILGALCIALTIVTSKKYENQAQGGGPDHEWDRDKPRVR